jgi:hypothetical protein
VSYLCFAKKSTSNAANVTYVGTYLRAFFIGSWKIPAFDRWWKIPAYVTWGRCQIDSKITARKQGCQLVYISDQKSQFGYVFEGIVVGIFSGHMEYFTVVSYILWSFGKLVQEKSGNHFRKLLTSGYLMLGLTCRVQRF